MRFIMWIIINPIIPIESFNTKDHLKSWNQYFIITVVEMTMHQEQITWLSSSFHFYRPFQALFSLFYQHLAATDEESDTNLTLVRWAWKSLQMNNNVTLLAIFLVYHGRNKSVRDILIIWMDHRPEKWVMLQRFEKYARDWILVGICCVCEDVSDRF